MRLVQVAKALGMTGQQLRHELESVNFGVKPSDREVPDNLAQGIIRFISRKHGIKVDLESLGFSDKEKESDGTAGKETGLAEAGDAAILQEKKEESSVKEPLHVLRKLTLEDVSKEAIQYQQKTDPALIKKEKEELRLAEKASQTSFKIKPGMRSHQVQIKKKAGVVMVPPAVTVKEFAEKAGVQVPAVISVLMKNGVMATINQTIDFDTAAIVASELGVEVSKEQDVLTADDVMSRNLEALLKDDPEKLEPRPPVVVVMGHVDHGKTSILDAIRKTDVASGEAGGITQHIGAYQVEHKVKGAQNASKITFLDTPGHEAFTAMRARGARVTDIAVIVIAADEGVKPTTVEAINHAKEAQVPILVAINKMDREGANPEKIKGEISAQGLQPEEWGGKTPVVLCSAKSNFGIDELLDSIVLVSEISEFKANPNRPAVATVIESHLDPSLGPLASVIVNAGTLACGDVFVCGSVFGKIRTMIDYRGAKINEVLPSGAVRISGFEGMPAVGDILQVVPSATRAKDLMQELSLLRQGKKRSSFIDLVSRLAQGRLTQLKVVLKADTQGSLEAIKDAFTKQTAGNVSVKVIHAAIGAVSESDVMMAAASEGVVISFSAPVSSDVRRTAEREGVQVREYDVIYKLFDDIDALIKGLIEPEETENILGHLEIKAVFMTKKSEQIVGGRVLDGSIKRLAFRLLRDGKEEGTGRILSLKHGDKDIKEAKEGTECGMKTECNIAIQEGDVLEVFLRELKKRET